MTHRSLKTTTTDEQSPAAPTMTLASGDTKIVGFAYSTACLLATAAAAAATATTVFHMGGVNASGGDAVDSDPDSNSNRVVVLALGLTAPLLLAVLLWTVVSGLRGDGNRKADDPPRSSSFATVKKKEHGAAPQAQAQAQAQAGRRLSWDSSVILPEEDDMNMTNMTTEESSQVLWDLIRRNVLQVSDVNSSLRNLRMLSAAAGGGHGGHRRDSSGVGVGVGVGSGSSGGVSGAGVVRTSEPRREHVRSQPVRLPKSNSSVGDAADDATGGGRVSQAPREAVKSSPVAENEGGGGAVERSRPSSYTCHPKSPETRKFLEESLGGDNFIFDSLTAQELALLVDAFQPHSVPPNTTIIRQGDMGDYFYLVEKGNVRFNVDGRTVGWCSRGASFGELALLYDCPRAATCKSDTECDLWKLEQRTFRYIISLHRAEEHGDLVDGVLRKVPFLSELEEGALDKIADALTTVTYGEGEEIIRKGDIGEDFFIVRDGRAKVTDISVGDTRFVDMELGSGDFFGERALLTGEPRMANVVAVGGPVTCLQLGRETFERMLGPLQELIDQATKKRVLLGMSSFAGLKPKQIDGLIDLITGVSFPKGHKISEVGKPLKHRLHYIYKGKIEIVNSNGVINYLQEGSHFGENTLKKDDGCKSKATITVMEEGTKCGVLTREDIEKVAGPINLLGRHLSLCQSTANLLSLDFDDLKKIRMLGMGAFGKVWLVQNTADKDKAVYAMKVLNKRQVLNYQQEEGVVREKNILASIHHPFVLDLVCSHQDEENLYMVIDLIQGGELFNVVHREERHGIPNADATFYAACVLEGLAHLHERNICYRDLKPENVLIDDKGYCIIVDLGFAKVVTNKTYTLCGTPEYLSPEIVLGKGHNKGADYWALGVLIYEMLVGKSPFFSHDQVKLFRRIVQCEFSYPLPGEPSEAAKDIVAKLLVKSVSVRLGCLVGADMDVRNHTWLSEIDSEKLLKREIEAPWVPNITDPLDSSNFESMEMEEVESEKSAPPLKPKQQEKFSDF